MLKTKHTVNGVLCGMWVETDDRKLYIALRKPRQLIFRSDAWGIDQSLLMKAQERGVDIIGVAVKRGKRFDYYMARLTDFFTDSFSFQHYHESVRQRALPRNRFRVRPDLSEAHIVSVSRVR